VKVAVLGAGAWGTTVASLLATKSEARLWALESEVVSSITDRRENCRYLPGFSLPSTLHATIDFGEALDGAELVVVAVPSRYLHEVILEAAAWIPGSTPVLSLTKGIELESGRRMTEVLRGILSEHDPGAIGVLSGPNLAYEVMTGHPSATCVAFSDKEPAEAIQRLLMSDRLRVYTSSDVVGCEIGGAVKNVIAIAAGVADGLGYGMNTKAALITRGLAEMSRLGVAVGGHPLTFLGLAGNGDLILTCSSSRSRNHYVGEELAKGRRLDDIRADMTSVAEGVETTPGVLRLAERQGVVMPISQTVDSLLSGRLTAEEVVTRLMRREPRQELEGLL
jgi:glycerol-3-phosphate dehydrogenase (NAD(P)+)